MLAGKFRVLRVLGEGGMGVVVLAEHTHLREKVALKLLRGDQAQGAEGLRRMQREAQAVAALRGEHIVRVMDVGQLDDGSPYIVMEYVVGATLGELLAREGPLSPERAVSLILSLCVGLAEAHAKGIVHRDLKPSNLILARRTDGSPIVKVLDFGIAKRPPSATLASASTSAMLGSPSYMSPEQIRDSRGVDARADIWSAAVVLYELLTRRLPFEAYTAASVLASVISAEPLPPSQHAPDLPRALEEVVLGCLSKEPAGRPADVGALAAALAPWGDPALVAQVHAVLRESSLPLPSERPPPAPSAEANTATTHGRPAWLNRADTVDATEQNTPQPSPRKRPLWPYFAALGLVGAGSAWALRRQAPPEPPGATQAAPASQAPLASAPLDSTPAPLAPASTSPVATADASAAAPSAQPTALASTQAPAGARTSTKDTATATAPPARTAPAPATAPAAGNALRTPEGEFGGRR